MSLLGYCILARPESEGRLPGQVRLAGTGELVVAVSEVAGQPPVDAASALAFESVVEWFHERAPAIIPVRFGSVFEDEAAIEARLRSHAGHFRRLLQELDHAVEVGIRMLADAPRLRPPDRCEAPRSGASWLEARRSHYHDLDRAAADLKAVAARVRDDLAGGFRRSRQEAGPGLLSMYFLVSREGASAFLERARRVRVEGARVLVSGPWPPYNFAIPAEEAA